MKVLAIVNPVSGRRNLAGALYHVVRSVCERNCPIVVRLTRAAGDAARIAADAPDDTRAILVAGGDGTVREVIDGLIAANRSIPVSIMRTGTENLIAKELNQATNPTRIAETLLRGRPMPCDVGVVNGRHFLLVTGAGFDAEVVHRLAGTRQGHITHLSYFWPLWRTFWSHRFPRLMVTADGDRIFDGHALAFVGVMGRYSLGLRLLKRARPDDGMLDLCILPCRSRPRLVRHAVDTLLRVHDHRPGAIYRKCLTIRIEGQGPVPLEIDGDAAGHLPAECTVLPAAATFLVPPPSLR